jgi:hypothetical protein
MNNSIPVPMSRESYRVRLERFCANAGDLSFSRCETYVSRYAGMAALYACDWEIGGVDLNSDSLVENKSITTHYITIN